MNELEEDEHGWHEESKEEDTVLDETGGEVCLSHGRGIGIERNAYKCFYRGKTNKIWKSGIRRNREISYMLDVLIMGN